MSVCLPARNEEATVGDIVAAVVDELGVAQGLVQEVVVIDDGSTDGTAAVATEAGARVFAVADLLPELGSGTGKGEALWKALFVSAGEILVFLDADLRDFDTRYITDLVAPLVADEQIVMAKARYRRDLNGAGQGGRVNELVARPLIELFFPQLAHIVQPLGGEFAARRAALERLPMVEGYGVDLALLIDTAEMFGAARIAQVDLQPRVHRNRPLEELKGQAVTVMHAGLSRAGVAVPPLAQRPPAVEVPAYADRASQPAAPFMGPLPRGGPPPPR